jgi:hypothetical protein
VNQGTKFYRKRQCLTTRPTTGVDDHAKLVSRKRAQDMQGISVAARPELFNTTEAQADWIVGDHVPLDCLVPDTELQPRLSRPSGPLT